MKQNVVLPPVSGISNTSSVGNTVFGPEIIREIMGFEPEAHIDELAETSIKNNKPYETDTKNHAFAKDGFEYRTAYFKDFDGNKLNISIGHNGNVATIYNVGEIKKHSTISKSNCRYGLQRPVECFH